MTERQMVAEGAAESATAKAVRRLAREAKVVRLAAEGLRPRDISERLGMDSHTISDILRRAGVPTGRKSGNFLPAGMP